MVTPVAYRSKKYFVMGKVTSPGAYVLDRPVTIVEALARAKGLSSGLIDRNSIDLADLGRSFLIRNGQRYAVDFERLFEQGDFSQNLQLEPQDFLYFAPANLKEIYVLGQVRNPGAVSYAPNKTVVGRAGGARRLHGHGVEAAGAGGARVALASGNAHCGHLDGPGRARDGLSLGAARHCVCGQPPVLLWGRTAGCGGDGVPAIGGDGLDGGLYHAF